MFKKKNTDTENQTQAPATPKAKAEPAKHKKSSKPAAAASKVVEPPLNLGQKSIFEMPDMHFLNTQTRILNRTYWVLIILIIAATFATAAFFGYLVLDDQFEWALLIDGTDYVCIK